ncbi:MAG: hypothetical protein KGS72_27280 [Cyanobacteria bacterium REEB67]|nr:hypothetical protein [Cyanobacteria bacterium REEB67]
MNQDLALISKIRTAAISLVSLSADVTFYRAAGADVEIYASTPANWQLSESGAIVEVGGPLPEALKTSPAGSRFSQVNASVSGKNISIGNVTIGGITASSVIYKNGSVFRSGMVNGKFYVNNEVVELPDPRERLHIGLPEALACDVDIEAEYFGSIDIPIALSGKLTGHVSSQVRLFLGDQTALTSASLDASMGAEINASAITAAGRVKLNAEMSDSKLTTGQVRGEEVIVKATMGGRIETRNLLANGDINLHADGSASRVDCEHISAVTATTKAEMGGRISGKNIGARTSLNIRSEGSDSLVRFIEAVCTAVEMKTTMSGLIKVEQVNAKRLDAKADMSARIVVLKGSAESGKASADMSARIELSGDFAALVCKRSMRGVVNVVDQKGTPQERFSNAAKRGFNRDLWGNPHAAAIALAMAGSMATVMQNGLAEALEDETFITVVCQAIEPAFADSTVDAIIRKCGYLFAAQVTLDDLANQELVGKAFQSKDLLEAFQQAIQLFLQTVFNKAKTFTA